MNYNELLLRSVAFQRHTTTQSSFLNSLNIQSKMQISSSHFTQRSNLYNNRLVYSDNFANDYYYQSSRTWCNSQRDYCPLVIALISVVIFITLILIIVLCVKNRVRCRSFRNLVLSCRNKLFKNSSQQQSQHQHIISNPNRSNLETLNALRNPTVSRASRSAFRSSNLSERNIWFIGNFSSKATPPPPSYEESQKFANRSSLTKLHSNPLNQSANINNAFSFESINENSSPSAVFPSYRYIALSTSPNTRATIQRLSNLSRQLLQENGYTQANTSNFVRVGTLNINNDEVPPDYESVIKSCQNINQETQVSSVEILI